MSREQKPIKLKDLLVIVIAWLFALLLAYAVFLKYKLLAH
jgi:hypothetical protein